MLLVGTTVASWDDAFRARLTGARVVRYDLRDTGRADVVDPAAPALTSRDLVATRRCRRGHPRVRRCSSAP